MELKNIILKKTDQLSSSEVSECESYIKMSDTVENLVKGHFQG